MKLKVLIAVLAVVLCALLLAVFMLEPPEPSGETVPSAGGTAPLESTAPPATVPDVTEPPATEPQPTETEPPATEPPADSFSEMGEIHITTLASVGDEYGDAQLEASWHNGSAAAQTVQIRLRGQSSKLTKKKSFNIKFLEKVEFMGMDPGKKWSLLANPFDKSLLRIVLGFDAADAFGLPYVSQTRLCKLWLDGVYQGIYVAVEPVDEGKNRVDIDITAGDYLLERNLFRAEEGVPYAVTIACQRFEINEPEAATQAQIDQCTLFLNQVEQSLQTYDHTEYEKYVDIESFVNFYIFEELIKELDFGEYSTRYFIKDGMLYAGPPWDLDLSMGNVSTSMNEDKYRTYNNRSGFGDNSGDSANGLWANNKDFFQWLCQDPYFMERVAERWQQVRPIAENLYQDNGLGENRIDRYLGAHLQALESNYSPDGAGWNVAVPELTFGERNPAKDYLGNVESLRAWLQRRVAYLDTQFVSENG